MTKIKSKTDLINYIKTQLGFPLINIELTDEQIESNIDQAVQKFADYAQEGLLENIIVCEFHGKGAYPLPDNISSIISVGKGSTSNVTNFGTNYGTGYVPDVWSQQFFSTYSSSITASTIFNDNMYASSLTGNIIPAVINISNTTSVLHKYFGDAPAYTYSAEKHTLWLTENYHGPAYIHYYYEYDPNEEHDKIYDHQWVKEYSVALCMRLWGRVTGKFSGSLIGGAQVNYSDLKSEGQAEIDRLNEELLTRWTTPCEIFIE
jgi:hypothetical protein